MRQAVASASVNVQETAGLQVATSGEAVAALDRARSALQRAIEARNQALATLEQANGAADIPLRQAADVLTARRAIAAIIVGLFVLLLVVVMS